MSRQAVNTIITNVGLTVNQSSTPPPDGNADWLLWLAFINRSQVEWAESNDWEQLKKTYYATVSLGTGYSMASIGLPLDYRKLAGPIVNWSSNISGGETWAEILPERKEEYSHDIDKVFWTQGDPSNGYSLQWNVVYWTMAGGSGATIEINYYSMPTSLASGTQYPVVPDSEFLTQRTIAYVLESRSDPRYQDEEQKARERLVQMIENANAAKYNSYVNPIKILTPENKSNFRFGRN